MQRATQGLTWHEPSNVFSLHGVDANGKVALKRTVRLNERHMRIEDEYGRLRRKNV